MVKKSPAGRPEAGADRNVRQEPSARRGAGSTPARCRIRPDRGDPDRVAQPDQFSVDPAVASGRILPCDTQDQLADLPADRRPTGRLPRVGPLSCEKLTVPAQYGRRGDEERTPAGPGE